MKITKSLLLMGMATFMCACSNEAEGLIPEGGQESGTSSELVEIKLGGRTASVESRAAIKDDGSGSINGIAVWCLAKEGMQENMSPQDIVWFGNQPENATCCIMPNVKANIVANEVRWHDANAVHYYPVTQFYRYEFYANYPYTTDLTQTETSVAANYTIDGTQDLLWGRATSDDPYAWSAKYFRQNGGQTLENRPKLEMQHMLTRLVFHVQPGPQVEIPGASEDELDFTAATQMRVDTLQICNAYTKLQVKIADYNNLNMGIGARVTATDATIDTLFLKGANGDIVSPIQVPALPSLKTQWGESIMLLSASQYLVRLVLHDNAGRKYESEIPLVLGNQPSFERGKSYNITITVHGAASVTLGATLTEWEEVDGPELNL